MSFDWQAHYKADAKPEEGGVDWSLLRKFAESEPRDHVFWIIGDNEHVHNELKLLSERIDPTTRAVQDATTGDIITSKLDPVWFKMDQTLVPTLFGCLDRFFPIFMDIAAHEHCRIRLSDFGRPNLRMAPEYWQMAETLFGMDKDAWLTSISQKDREQIKTVKQAVAALSDKAKREIIVKPGQFDLFNALLSIEELYPKVLRRNKYQTIISEEELKAVVLGRVEIHEAAAAQAVKDAERMKGLSKARQIGGRFGFSAPVGASR